MRAWKSTRAELSIRRSGTRQLQRCFHTSDQNSSAGIKLHPCSKTVELWSGLLWRATKYTHSHLQCWRYLHIRTRPRPSRALQSSLYGTTRSKPCITISIFITAGPKLPRFCDRWQIDSSCSRDEISQTPTFIGNNWSEWCKVSNDPPSPLSPFPAQLPPRYFIVSDDPKSKRKRTHRKEKKRNDKGCFCLHISRGEQCGVTDTHAEEMCLQSIKRSVTHYGWLWNNIGHRRMDVTRPHCYTHHLIT